MDRRMQLILDRARELFSTSHPGETWPKAVDRPDAKLMERQAQYLARAEDQLLKEGKIEIVDQS